MNNNAVKDGLKNINDDIKKIPMLFEKATNALAINDTVNYEKCLIKGVLELEKATIKARNYANITLSMFGASELYDRYERYLSENVYNITITRDGDVMHITTPVLLPHYKESYKSIISEPLNRAFKEYKGKGNIFPVYKSVVMCIVNRVSMSSTGSKVRDNDNRDYKQVVNTIAYWLLPDDSPKYCSMFNGTKFGEQDGTDIYIVPKEKFGEWFAQNSEAILS